MAKHHLSLCVWVARLCPMRFFVVFFYLLLSTGPALADQSDPGLEGLFNELRDGTALDAQATTARIVEIWATPASPTVGILYERAYEAALAGELSLADELCLHVTGLAPSFAQGWVLQASIKARLSKREAANGAYRNALDLEPRHFIALSDLADRLFASDEVEAAFELYQQALKWNPHYAPAREQAARIREQLSGQEI